jgi:hypothetical protein
MLRVEPRANMSRIDIAPPKRTKFSEWTETLLPILLTARRDNVEPRLRKSRTLSVLPRRICEIKLRPEPS